jgi:cleavage and polyadenylation specificity factor subunit 2
VGDLRLADLRRNMQSDGHKAEFSDEGRLLIDGVVKVRKDPEKGVKVKTSSLLTAEKGLDWDTLFRSAAHMNFAENRSVSAVKKRVYDGVALVDSR